MFQSLHNYSFSCNTIKKKKSLFDLKDFFISNFYRYIQKKSHYLLYLLF